MAVEQKPELSTQTPQDAKMSIENKKFIALIGAILLGLVIWFISGGLSPQGRVALSLTLLAIVLWIFEVFPIEITAILLSTFYVVLGAANTVDAFSGYGNETVWFIFSALVFGMAIDQSGVGKRIAYTLMRFSGSSFKSMMIIVIVVGLLLSFLTPAGVERLLIIYPIAVGIAAVFVKGEVKGSNTGKLAIAITYLAGNTFGFAVLTGIAVNILGIGIIKQILGVEIFWSQWITWFGVPLALTTIISIFLAFKLFPPEEGVMTAHKSEAKEEFVHQAPMTSVEIRALIFLLVTLALWVTDRWHHIPSWAVAIFSAILFCAPKFGVISAEQLKKIQFPIVLFSGAAISIGTVLSKTGVANWMGKVLLGTFIKPDMSNQMMGAITYLVGAVVHVPLVESKTAAAAFTPAVTAFFQTMGVQSVGPAVMSIISADTVALFPYMMMPFLAILGLGYLTMKDSVKLLSTYTAVAIVVNVISCFTWYHWTGLL
ncbi:SLC13 family permease [Desulfitobacterium sp. AusDCA]|uniref:SLC13 family permease n=1 Tax=Desulfitobacterium sp. AusDCA TaxID=3240383 RepID=UPI003DA6F4A4